MKWLIVPVLLGAIFLASCQGNSQQASAPQPTVDEANIQPPAALAEEPESVTENNSPAEPLASATSLAPTATPHGETLPGGGMANANVLFVKAQATGDSTWTFTVTVEHPDTGWEDYADGWDVLLPDGEVVKPDTDSPFTRLLLHPHETEQPFTRSQNGVKIPADVAQVVVRAHDLVDGFGGKEVVVDLTVESGPAFEVIR